jgi:hypothetical protein
MALRSGTSHQTCNSAVLCVRYVLCSSNELSATAQFTASALRNGCMTCRNLLQLVLHMATPGAQFALCWLLH